MKAKMKSLWIGLCGILAAIALVFGFWASNPTVEVSASGTTPTVTMVAGASVRKTEGEPGIKFTAVIDNYDASYQYGMLILPEAAWKKDGFDDNYHAYFTANGITQYADSICTPYQENDTYKISFSLKNILTYNYDMSFVGVAYTLKDGVYNYADINMLDNARSIAYVAQLALKYESGLSRAEAGFLEAYTQPGIIVDKEDYTDTDTITNNGAEVQPSNYVAKYVFNVSGESVSQVTKSAYAAGSTVSFKYYIPSGTTTQWWGLAWTTNSSSLDIYAAASNASAYPLSTVTGTWTDVSFTLPSGGPYYLYFGSEVGNWKLSDGSDAYVLIDDFTVGSTVEKFSASTGDWIFTVKSTAAFMPYEYEKGGFIFPSNVSYAAKIIVNNVKSDAGTPTFVTKQSYAAGSKISFKYYIGGTNGSWAKLCCVNSLTSGDIYANWILEIPVSTRGQWAEASVTLTSAGYLYFAADVGQWADSYILIDDFSVTTGGTTVTDDFDDGVTAGLFNVNTDGAVELVDGYKEIVDPTDYMLTFDASSIGGNERIAMITNEAYASVSEITFKAIWTGDASTARWGMSYTTNPGKFSYGAEVSAINCYTPKLGELKMDAGKLYEYRIAFTSTTYTVFANDSQIASGSYTQGTNYFYFMACPTVTGTTAFYLDDFSITYAGGTVTDTFANGRSALFVESSTKNSHYGSTGMDIVESTLNEEPEEQELAMKYIPNVTDAYGVITKSAYAAGSAVSFKYYIPEGTTTDWWGIAWNTVAGNANNYHAAGIEANYVGHTALGVVTGAWTDVSFTLPSSGGPYYLYFGSNCGNWKLNGANSYILIDDFTINNETDTFNSGFEAGLFTVTNTNKVMLSQDGEGYVVLNGAYGAKIYMNSISSDASKPTFITTNAYTLSSATTVTFDYYMSGNTSDKWWTFNWTTSKTVASIYAFVENNNNQKGVELPRVQGSWQKASVTVPAGTWYFYFAGAVGEWGSGYVIVDNIVVGDVVSENFNHGLQDSIFTVASTHTSVIELVDGKEDFVPGEYSAKIIVNSIKSDVGTPTFVTKQSYAAGSKISFKYYIGGTKGGWAKLCCVNSLSGGDIYANWILDIPLSTRGQWAEASITLTSAGYLYFAADVGQWADSYILIDDFSVTTGGTTVTDDFTNGVTAGLFNVNTDGAVIEADGYVAPPPSDDDPYALEYLLYYDTILQFLESGGYNYLTANGTLGENIPDSMVLLEGSFTYTITGHKEFAIWFGNSYYLFVDENSVALYNDTELLAEMQGSASAMMSIAYTAGGRLIVKVGGVSYKGLHVIDKPENLRWVALGGDGAILFTDIDFDTYTSTGEDAPVYFSTESIDFTAYAFDSVAMISDEGFQLLADAGFTKTLALLRGRIVGISSPSDAEVERLMTQVNADALAALELAEKYGLKHYVFNEALYNLERKPEWYDWVDDLKDSATYTLSNAFAGHYFADEPTYQTTGNAISGYKFDSSDGEIVELVEAYKAYKEAFPEGEAFINLLPLDTAAFSLFGSDTESYKGYVDYYIENIGKDLGYVSFDHYPLVYDGGLTTYHLFNLEYVATRCREEGLELRFYIKASQTGSEKYNKRATESINDLYMQIYSGLAFGAKEVVYYQFTDHLVTSAGVGAGDGVINGVDLQKTDVYNWVAQANNEVLAFSNAYMNFTWKNVSYYCYDEQNMSDQFDKIENNESIGDVGCLSAMDAGADILIGNFGRKEGVAEQQGDDDAYMVVNYGDTHDNTEASTVNMTFTGKTRALVYENGKAKVYTLSNNVLTLNLEKGEGAFVIPLD